MVEPLITSSYLAVVTVGLVHGLEPGHGWPVAAILATTARRRYMYGTMASAILAAAHFISSLAVVAVYYLSVIFFGSVIDFGSSWFKVLTAAILLVLAFRFFREKTDAEGTMGGGRQIMGLKGLAAFALVLGFAHEEEFMLFALFVGGVNPLIGMTSYALAVSASLIVVTLVAIRAFSSVEARMEKYQSYMPKITALVLTVLAILFLLPVIGGPAFY
jgi:ABC-type nickel/cobalt efflux system permease component RcnA